MTAYTLDAHRHAGLDCASTPLAPAPIALHATFAQSAKWTLKQVQGDKYGLGVKNLVEISLGGRTLNQFSLSIPNVRVDVESDREDYRAINRALRITERQLGEVEADIRAADRAVEIGKRLANERFGRVA